MLGLARSSALRGPGARPCTGPLPPRARAGHAAGQRIALGAPRMHPRLVSDERRASADPRSPSSLRPDRGPITRPTVFFWNSLLHAKHAWIRRCVRKARVRVRQVCFECNSADQAGPRSRRRCESSPQPGRRRSAEKYRAFLHRRSAGLFVPIRCRPLAAHVSPAADLPLL